MSDPKPSDTKKTMAVSAVVMQELAKLPDEDKGRVLMAAAILFGISIRYDPRGENPDAE